MRRGPPLVVGRIDLPQRRTTHHVSLQVPDGSTDGGAVSAAMSRALGDLAERIAATA